MKKLQNMGLADRIIRLILGIAALVIGFYAFGGVFQIVLYIIGVILLLTALVGICPLYFPFKISTKSKQ